MTEDKRQQIQIQIQKITSLGRLKIEGYKPPAELTGKAVSRGHHLSGPMLVTAKIHPILLSKNKSCRFEIYALAVKWTNSYIIWSILWVQRDRQILSHQTNTRNDKKNPLFLDNFCDNFPAIAIAFVFHKKHVYYFAVCNNVTTMFSDCNSE